MASQMPSMSMISRPASLLVLSASILGASNRTVPVPTDFSSMIAVPTPPSACPASISGGQDNGISS